MLYVCLLAVGGGVIDADGTLAVCSDNYDALC